MSNFFPKAGRTKRWLIVHADDLGISESVNSAIALAHEHGILTSASIMAVGEAFEDALRIYRSLPSLDIGVHLTLVEERPLSPTGTVASLAESSGRFLPTAMAFTQRYLSRRINMEEIYRELKAQVRRVLDAGIAVTHLDSHQHLHMLPGVFEITVRLAREYGIHAVRVPREPLSFQMARRSPSLGRVTQQLILNGFCLWSSRQIGNLHRPDHFAGFLFGGRMDISNLRTTLRNLPNFGSVEIMCHPNMDTPENRYAHWGYRGKNELEALVDPGLPALLKELGLSLGSYRDIS
jgi:chitin disaccharide deacetylase